jgi:murein L,D-transpeptidase YafK
MIEKYKKRFNLQLKKLEINLKTWKNAREIAKAYNQEITVKETVSTFLETQLGKILLIAGVTVAIIFLYFSSSIVFKQIKKQNTTVLLNVKSEKNVALKKVPKTQTVKDVYNVNRREQKNAESRNVNYSKPVSDNKKNNSTVAVNVKKDSLTLIAKVKLFLSQLNYRTVAIPESIDKKSLIVNAIIPPVTKNDKSVIAPTDSVIKKSDTEIPVTMKPSSVKKSAIKADYFIIIANKAKRQMLLLHQNNLQEWKIITQFDIAIGGGLAGRKVSAGDRRTPEGLYYILMRKDKNELSPIYGPLSYVLNYPNEIDKKEGRTGQGIWIHGTSGNAAPVPTKGCISLANKDITELSNYIESGVGTPVLIVSDSTTVDPVLSPDYEMVDRERNKTISNQDLLLASVNEFLSNWKVAWESRDINKYQQFYAIEHFNSQGMNWNSWKEKKILTFQMYNTINVTINKVSVSDWTDNSLEIKFLQNYKSDQKYFENGKKLFLEKDDRTWKITREITIPKEELLL